MKGIKEAWAEQKAIREVMMFLQTYGVTDALCLRLVRKYGDNTKSVLENDPYRIIRDVKGIGFKTADKIALNLGLSSNGPERIEAGILHTQQEAEDEGHTHMERREIALQASTLLEAQAGEVENRIQSLLANGELVTTHPDWLQFPSSSKAEQSIAKALKASLKTQSSLPSILIDKAVEWAQGKGWFFIRRCPKRRNSKCTVFKSSHFDRWTGNGKNHYSSGNCIDIKSEEGKGSA